MMPTRYRMIRVPVELADRWDAMFDSLLKTEEGTMTLEGEAYRQHESDQSRQEGIEGRLAEDALRETTVRIGGYDWNADPESITLKQGRAFEAMRAAIARVEGLTPPP